MILTDPSAFYYVYPSWANYRFKWADLHAIFLDPYGTGFLDNEPYWSKIRYKEGFNTFRLIDGPLGNGIIKGIGNQRSDRFLWMAVLMQETDFTSLPGFHYNAPDYGVHWMEEKGSAERVLGLKEAAPTFLPRVSLDYDDCPNSSVFVSLAFGTRTQDEELCLRFQMLAGSFGLNCQPVLEVNSLPDVTRKMVSPVINHRWFLMEHVEDDAGLLASKAFYLGCAMKYVSKRFKYIHLVGAFEGKPAMAQLWKEYAQHKGVR
jgi:hypothetical protein